MIIRRSIVLVSGLIFSAAQSGCTVTTIVADHLESYVVIGFGEKKEVGQCPVIERRFSLGVVAPCWDYPVDFVKDKSVPIWVKIVSSRDLTRPLPGRVIKFEVVDSRGVNITGATVAPDEIISDKGGFNSDEILFTSSRLGVFRVKATYDDYGSQIISYSPPISILSQ